MSHLFVRSKYSGLPSFAPAISFLQGAGQGHIVSQVKIALKNTNCSALSFTVKSPVMTATNTTENKCKALEAHLVYVILV